VQSTPQHGLFNPQSGMQALRRQPRDWAFAALVGLGVAGAVAGGAHPAKPVARVVLGGLAAMAFTIGVGHLFGSVVG
jgi:hypothetical protein